VMRTGRLIHVGTPDSLRRAAFGGEIIQFVVEPGQAYDVAKILQSQPMIRDVRRSPEQPGLLYVYVDDASDSLPQIFNVMNEHPEVAVQQADKYMPPFDDVFIRLMEQADNNNV
jgi:hypothetical protein